jgi:hypothetical protein
MSKRTSLGLGLLLATMAPFAAAQNAAPATTTPAHPHSINNRQKRQQERIDKGVQSGALNDKEAARLEKQQDNIAAREAKMRESGGKFTPAERKSIQRQETRTSRRIYRQKHDAQTAH